MIESKICPPCVTNGLMNEGSFPVKEIIKEEEITIWLCSTHYVYRREQEARKRKCPMCGSRKFFTTLAVPPVPNTVTCENNHQQER